MKASNKSVFDELEVVDRITLTSLQAQRLQEVALALKENNKAKLRMGGQSNESHLHNRTFADGVAAKLSISLVFPEDSSQPPQLVTRNTPSSQMERDSQNAYALFKAALLLVPGFREGSARVPVQTAKTQYELKVPCSPLPLTGKEPPLRFRGKTMFGVTELKLTELVHALGLGVPGSGKTHSYILPMVNAFLDYELNGNQPSMAVIDPKAELLKPIAEELTRKNQIERLVVIGECKPFLFFRENDALSTKDRYFKLKEIVPGTSSTSGNDERWQAFSDNLNIDWLRQDQEFLNTTGVGLFESILTLLELKDKMDVGQWPALHSIYGFGMGGMPKLRFLSDVYIVLTHCLGLDSLANPVLRYSLDDDMLQQWFYQARSATTVTEFAGAPELNNVVDFDTRQYGPDVKRDRLNIQSLIDEGKVLVYQPADSQAHTVAGKALKTQFFQAVKERQDMERLAVYVCDEYHRFISLADSGMLDIGRAYRMPTVAATQSIEAMRLSLGGSTAAASAVNGMLTNMPTKIVFRCTDAESFRQMKFLIPSHPQSHGHVLDVRPPSSLNPGESYFVIGTRWGRSQYQLNASTPSL